MSKWSTACWPSTQHSNPCCFFIFDVVVFVFFVFFFVLHIICNLLRLVVKVILWISWLFVLFGISDSAIKVLSVWPHCALCWLYSSVWSSSVYILYFYIIEFHTDLWRMVQSEGENTQREATDAKHLYRVWRWKQKQFNISTAFKIYSIVTQSDHRRAVCTHGNHNKYITWL